MSGEDISDKIRERIAEADRVTAQSGSREQAAQMQRQASRLYVGRLASRDGVAIRELDDSRTSLEARRLLAGFVSSALSAGIQTASISRRSGSPRHRALGLVANSLVEGWTVEISHTVTEGYKGSENHRYKEGILTTDYRFILPKQGSEYYDGAMETSVIERSVLEQLANSRADWAEPAPATYE